jgi:hypothetical protein
MIFFARSPSDAGQRLVGAIYWFADLRHRRAPAEDLECVPLPKESDKETEKSKKTLCTPSSEAISAE